MIVFTMILAAVFVFMIFVCGFIGPFMKLYDEYKANKIKKDLENRKI